MAVAQPVFEVLDGGLLTTIQDSGRPETTSLGVPVSGAADPWTLARANILVGNEPEAAALELTIVGPSLRALRPVTIALSGADLGARVDGRWLPPDRTHHVQAGQVMTFAGPGSGARAILALPGGFDVPIVLGSRSTCLAGGFGGFHGRAIRAGDVLMGRPDFGSVPGDRAWPAADRPGPARPRGPLTLRVLPASSPGIEALVDRTWRVAPASDRVGTRLEGEPVPPGIGGEATTHGVPWGAIQVPSDGRPIILGPDHQTTGGYRVVAAVVSADRPVFAALTPGDPVRLVRTSMDEAVESLRTMRQALADGAAALREADHWTALAHTAGG